MLIEPGSPVLDELEGSDVTVRLRLRELLDPPITDWPGQAQVEAAHQLRGLIAALQGVVDVLDVAAQTLSLFSPDDDGDDPKYLATEVRDLDRIEGDHRLRLVAQLDKFDRAMAEGFEV